jgi:ssDNA-binding Zn-finger/Zn-ribbon topoisomerase 1
MAVGMVEFPSMKADEKIPEKAAYTEQTCPFCKFQFSGPKARKSNQCPRCHKTICVETKERSIIEFP